jgi:hypothetical protein
MAILRMVQLDFALLAVIICLLMTNKVHELLTQNDKNWRLIYFVLTALVLITSQHESVLLDSIKKIPVKVRMFEPNFCYPENRTVEIEKISSMEQCKLPVSSKILEADENPTIQIEEKRDIWKIYAECAAGCLIGAIALLGKF